MKHFAAIAAVRPTHAQENRKKNQHFTGTFKSPNSRHIHSAAHSQIVGRGSSDRFDSQNARQPGARRAASVV
jgi:hypothetical protein